MATHDIANINRERLMEKLTHELPVLRARLGASQADIAEKIGISRQTYNSIETRKKKMNWTMFVALIALFQNNEETRQMIERVDELAEEIKTTMNISGTLER